MLALKVIRDLRMKYSSEILVLDTTALGIGLSWYASGIFMSYLPSISSCGKLAN